MTTDTSRLGRLFVIGFILCFSLGVNAKTGTIQSGSIAKQWFDQGSALIKQSKLEQGLSLFKKAAAKGHGQAAFELASLYEVGLAVEQDFGLAKKYYEMAVRQGHRDAHFNLALFLSNPMTPNNNLKRARKVVTVIAEQGDVEAQFLLSKLMSSTLQKVGANPGKAFYWLQHAANSGHGNAQFVLGTQYMKGVHVSKSTKTALKWFNRASLQNIPEAHYNLAVMYEKGEGVTKNVATAINWYESAAELGSADAQQNLGIKYLAGDYVEPMPKKALQLLTSAANSGSRNSQMLLGKIYHSGYKDHIKKDLAMAELWYLKAARQGKTEAQYQLALMLLDKENGTVDAKFWIRRAVAAGHVGATKLQANL